jgi:phosphoribosylformylglycinamidine synthase
VKIGIVVFPGSNCDYDAYRAAKHVMGIDTVWLWHGERDLQGVDAIILPGGFSYGDYLRCGAIARFSPVMESVVEFANRGGPVIGICNGFQTLCEAGLLPGALIRNSSLRFSCKWVNLRCESKESVFTSRYFPGEVISVPIAHGEGCYVADRETLAMLEDQGEVVWRYCAPDGTSEWEKFGWNGAAPPAYNPNGSLHNIAGIRNERGNVLGMMPHPERAVESVIGGTDGRRVFESAMAAAAAAAAT